MKGLTLTEREQTRLQVLNGLVAHRIATHEAATILGLSERHTWRMLAAYRKEGAAALAHGNRGRRPRNAVAEEIRQRVITLARTRYEGFNHTHLTEILAEREGVALTRSTVRTILLSAGLPSPRYRRPPRHRYRRQRMPQEGMLLQLDGSYHAWLEDRGPWLTLLLAVDDATGTVPHGVFREREDTQGYFTLMKSIVTRHGIPLGVYTDRHSIFQSPDQRLKEVPATRAIMPTQCGRALRELGITQVFAHSPEAKGRVERANGTFQDRLVAELRLAGASTLKEANDVLSEFLPRYNTRFGVPPAQAGSAYRVPDAGLDLDGVLCLKERRRVAKDNTVQYHGRTLQLFPHSDRPSYAGARVEVQERLDGRILVSYRGTVLTPQEAPPLAASLRAQAYAVPKSAAPEDPEPPPPPIRKRPSPVTWYEDSELKRRHRELVVEGMERARQLGKRIGRPSVTERDGFPQRFAAVAERIGPGGLSLRRAAKELEIGFATLKRLLDAPMPPEATPAAQGSSFSPVHVKIVHHNKPVGKVAGGMGGCPPCPQASPLHQAASPNRDDASQMCRKEAQATAMSDEYAERAPRTTLLT